MHCHTNWRLLASANYEPRLLIAQPFGHPSPPEPTAASKLARARHERQECWRLPTGGLRSRNHSVGFQARRSDRWRGNGEGWWFDDRLVLDQAGPKPPFKRFRRYLRALSAPRRLCRFQGLHPRPLRILFRRVRAQTCYLAPRWQGACSRP